MDKLIILIPIFFWSAWSIIQKAAVSHMSPLWIQFISVLTCFCCAPIFYYFAPKSTPMNMPGIGFAIAGSICAIAAGTSFLFALNKMPASVAVALGSTYPLLSGLFAVIFLGETMTLARIGGMICIVSGAILLSR